MKSITLIMLVASLSSAAHAQAKLQIEQVGLQNSHSNVGSTMVRVHIPPLPESQTIGLVFRVGSWNPVDQSLWHQTDVFKKQVQMAKGVSLDLTVPILLPDFGNGELSVTEIDADNRKISEDTFPLSFSKDSAAVAIFCRDDSQCLTAQKQISPIPTTEEASTPSNTLRLALLKNLQTDWLAYRSVDAVVIAGSIGDITSDQARGLEHYLRSGGIIVLIEKEAAAGGFLADYRRGAIRSGPVRVGKGNLYRISSLESQDLIPLFVAAPGTGKREILPAVGVLRYSPIASTLDHVGPTFTFPRLRWLLIWAGVYILVIGPVNFAALKHLRRLEWGWATVVATALLFAAVIYLNSSVHRPKHFTLDSAAIYWMDGKSPVAYEDLGIRISSPRRSRVSLTIDSDVSLADRNVSQASDSSDEYLGTEINGHSAPREGMRVQLGPPLKLEVPMRTWSLRDTFAEGFHNFAGTVHWVSVTQLRNDTGRGFREAIFLDFKANKKYAISRMAPNDAVDLTNIVPEKIYGTRKTGTYIVPGYAILTHGQLADRSFSLEEFLEESSSDLAPLGHVLAAVLEPAEASAGLDAAGTIQQNIEVAVVALDQP